jgi:tetratricopeptide (TPR) repeat protein
MKTRGVEVLKKSLAFLAAFTLNTACVSTSPQEDNLLNLGNEYAKDGLLREAADTYRKGLDKHPDNPILRRNLGIVLVKSGAYKAAIAQFEKVIGALDSDYDTNFYLAEAYRAEEKYAEAIYRYQKALRKKENSLRSMKALAWSYYKIRYYDEAMQITRRMQKISNDDPQVAVITARTLIKLNRHKSAMSVLTRAKRTSKPEVIPYLQSVEGDALVSRGQCREAVEIYREALKVQPLLAGSLMGIGKCLVDLGEAEKGAAYLIRAVRIKPNLAEAYYALGQAYEKSQPTKAIAFYRQFRKFAGKDPEFLNKMATAEHQTNSYNSHSGL